MVKNTLKRKLVVALTAVLLFGTFGVDTSYAAGITKMENCADHTNPCTTTEDVNKTLYETAKTLSVKKRVTYYSAAHVKRPDYYRMGIVRKIILKKNKVVTYGSFCKSKNEYSPNGTYCKNKKRTFKLANNVKFYSRGGDAGKQRQNREYAKSLSKIANGLGFILKVKNGKVVEIIFAS